VSNDRDKTVWMDAELELAIYRLAEADDRAFSTYCRMVLRRHVEQCTQQVEQPEAPQRPASGRAAPHTTYKPSPERIGRIADRVRSRMQQDDSE
jgi:hypothetical protein